MYDSMMKLFTDMGLLREDDRGRNGLFELQRRNFGKAHGLSGEIRTLSKQCICAITDGRLEDAQWSLGDMDRKLKELEDLNLPALKREEFLAEAGQEYVEAVYVQIFHDIVVNGNTLREDLPTAKKLGVTEPCLLAGIGDAATEMSRIIGKILLDEKLSHNDRLAFRQRLVVLLNDVHKALDQFETVVPYVVQNSTRKGYGNTYRALLGRISGAAQHHADRIIDSLDRR